MTNKRVDDSMKSLLNNLKIQPPTSSLLFVTPSGVYYFNFHNHLEHQLNFREMTNKRVDDSMKSLLNNLKIQPPTSSQLFVTPSGLYDFNFLQHSNII